MTTYDNKNTFTLFRNTKKREGKNDADFSGSFTDSDGNEYWINAWSKSPKNGGDKFLSGNVRRKDASRPSPRPAQNRSELSDDVPF